MTEARIKELEAENTRLREQLEEYQDVTKALRDELRALYARLDLEDF